MASAGLSRQQELTPIQNLFDNGFYNPPNLPEPDIPHIETEDLEGYTRRMLQSEDYSLNDLKNNLEKQKEKLSDAEIDYLAGFILGRVDVERSNQNMEEVYWDRIEGLEGQKGSGYREWESVYEALKMDESLRS